ncbi:MAG: hypothetical protein HUK09_03960 [Bacteroidaceae bacterium]|nr:hypothetical protein [Bacteroidaceae bacterium]
MFQRFITVTLIWLISVCCAIAQPAQIKAHLERNTMLIGEQQRLTVRVETNKQGYIQFADLTADQLGAGIEILRVTTNTLAPTAEFAQRQERTYLITAFDSAQYQLPPMRATIEGVEVVDTTLLQLRVDFPAHNASTQENIRPTLPPVQAAFVWSPHIWLWSLLPAGLLLAIATLIFLYYRNRHSQEDILAIPPIEESPKAEDQLEEIAHLPVDTRKSATIFYDQLSACLRTHIGQHLGIPAMELTTNEIADQLAQQLKENQYRPIIQTLTTADWVKYAKYLPPATEQQQSLALAKQFVAATQSEVQMTTVPERPKKKNSRGQIYNIAILTLSLSIAGCYAYVAYLLWLNFF